MEMKKLVKGMTVAGLFALSSNTCAATADGLLDTTSTGTVDINVIVGDLIQISGMVPMVGTTYVPGADVNYTTPACVYRNGSANYEVTATSENGVGTNFFLSDGTNDVVYNVTYQETGTVPAVALSNGTLNSTFTNANTTIADCSAGTGGDVTIAVSIPETHATFNGVGEVPAATYIDELSILVAPR